MMDICGGLTRKQIARFWAKVDKSGECWIWTGARSNRTYGCLSFTVNGKKVVILAHRLAWQLSTNEELGNRVVRHSCDNTLCCNPKHLKAGSQQANIADRQLKMRTAIGESHGRAKLTFLQVDAIRRCLSYEVPMEVIATVANVDRKTIQKIRDRKTWRVAPPRRA